ncbi:MAG TPA: efflux RND transporter periplasmic adaptor subunit, partial [Acetobacteraceae bacterium]|nr:efflux RND transporter periplasmic adaptor subunit [Acetobacteraceae bacterium]
MDIGTRDAITLEERPRTRRSRLVVGLVSAILLVGIGAAIWLWPAGRGTRDKSDRGANAPVPVLVAAAAQRDVPIWLDALGTVQAYSTVTVKPMVDGPLIEVDFKEGQEVKKGDVLARIDPRTYQAAFDQAVAKKAQDEALLANAKVDLARYQKLVQNNYTTAQQADTQKATVAQLTAQLNSDQAAIDNARTLLGYTTITAPIDGRAGIRQVDAGNIVHASDATGLVVLTQIRPISVLFNLPQQDLSQIAASMQQPSPPLVVAMNETGPGSGTVLDQGQLAVLDNQVDPTTGTIKLKAT